MSLIKFSVSMSLRLPKAMVRQHRESLYSSRPPAHSESDSERPLFDKEFGGSNCRFVVDSCCPPNAASVNQL